MSHNALHEQAVHPDGPPPQGARPDLSVEGTIEIERPNDVLYVRRPAYGQQGSTVRILGLVEATLRTTA